MGHRLTFGIFGIYWTGKIVSVIRFKKIYFLCKWTYIKILLNVLNYLPSCSRWLSNMNNRNTYNNFRNVFFFPNTDEMNEMCILIFNFLTRYWKESNSISVFSRESIRQNETTKTFEPQYSHTYYNSIMAVVLWNSWQQL